jgi:hypothetical protein
MPLERHPLRLPHFAGFAGRRITAGIDAAKSIRLNASRGLDWRSGANGSGRQTRHAEPKSLQRLSYSGVMYDRVVSGRGPRLHRSFPRDDIKTQAFGTLIVPVPRPQRCRMCQATPSDPNPIPKTRHIEFPSPSNESGRNTPPTQRAVHDRRTGHRSNEMAVYEVPWPRGCPSCEPSNSNPAYLPA